VRDLADGDLAVRVTYDILDFLLVDVGVLLLVVIDRL
jgi:hypothetical protein